MAEKLASLVPMLVVVLLAVGVWRQFVPVGRWGHLWDMLALVPQWRFYAQDGIAEDEAWFDDPHLLVRVGSDGTPSEWQPVFWLDERPLLEMLWNPRRRAREQLVEFMELLSDERQPRGDNAPVSSVPYLSVLRLCLERTDLPAGSCLQFAVVRSRGRGERPVAPGFVSQWHVP